MQLKEFCSLLHLCIFLTQTKVLINALMASKTLIYSTTLVNARDANNYCSLIFMQIQTTFNFHFLPHFSTLPSCPPLCHDRPRGTCRPLFGQFLPFSSVNPLRFKTRDAALLPSQTKFNQCCSGKGLRKKVAPRIACQ